MEIDRMDFRTAIRTCIVEKYATFQGRAPRSEFWYYTLFAYISGLLAGFVDYVSFQKQLGQGPFSIILMLALAVPGLAAQVRRLHDTERSGWYILYYTLALLSICLLTVSLILIFSENSALLLAVAAISFLANIAATIYFIYFLVSRGTPGPNAYGADPLA